jgi:hypothetical protein
VSEKGHEVRPKAIFSCVDQREQRNLKTYLLSRTSRDWYPRIVTLNEVKGLAVRFFAALRMTLLRGYAVQCTNVLNPDLEAFRALPGEFEALSERLRD